MSSLKNEISASDFEVEAQDAQRQVQHQAKLRLVSLVHGIRVALTVLALAAGITVLGVAANGLIVYHETYLPPDFFLQLWPAQFDLRPTQALVAGGVLVVVANLVSLLFSRVQALRSKTGLHAIASLAAPAIGFVASLVAMSLFYAVNASTTVDSLQSWSCRWKDVPMRTQPHFGTLCRQSEAGVALSVMLVPLEAAILAVAGYQVVLERQAARA
ncbi:tryptophanyl-tRNA synthetase [Trichoderma parareesei]|uniref:Tryptophanyl-tRNA synthetase n=1 Tax=Trichoderma parareesei TaxID=858221 RepID=A0A2H3A1E7_TRIPA|nr:tryptophanyl-tRNA synthetase [Trichoderma parareesei]